MVGGIGELLFRGTHHHSIDAKGRTSLPAVYRELLKQQGADRLIVTRGPDRALWAFAPASFEVLERNLAAHSQLDRMVRHAVDFLVGNAVDCTLDKMGRVLVPQVLRDWAGIEPEGEVVWVGGIDRIRLWSGPRWTAANGSGNDELDAATTDFLASLGI